MTSNVHKFEEVTDFFEDTEYGFSHIKQSYPEIQAPTFRQIVLYSSAILSTTIQQPFLIEDSGLSVDELNGFPGPYSSYVYKTIGWEGLLKLLKSATLRSAYFTSIFALVKNDDVKLFEGVTKGNISKEGLGEGGFGFDPIFVPKFSIKDGTLNKLTYAELDMKLKNYASHRGKALAKLKEYLISL